MLVDIVVRIQACRGKRYARTPTLTVHPFQLTQALHPEDGGSMDL